MKRKKTVRQPKKGDPEHDALLGSLSETAKIFIGLEEAAARAYAPIVEDIINSRSRDDREIHRALDGMLGFCGNQSMLLLYKKLCRYYLPINPAATADYIQFYREQWDPESLKKSCKTKKMISGRGSIMTNGGDMLYVYLDKSGDLDFDFVKKKPSRFFTLCALVFRGQANALAMNSAVKRSGRPPELTRGAQLLNAQKCFYKRVKGIEFGLYAVTLDKWKACAMPVFDKDRICAYMAGLMFGGVDFKATAVRVTMPADKLGLGKGDIRLRDYIRDQVQGRVDLAIPLDILYLSSRDSYGLKAPGMFARGVHMKSEEGDLDWYSVFKEKVRSEKIY